MIVGRRWMLFLLLMSGWGGPVAGGAETTVASPTLAQSVAHLVEAHAQLQGASAVANLAVPGGLGDVLIVRRTIAADWQRRLDAAEVPTDDPGLQRFTGEIQALVSGMQQLANLAQQLGDAPRRFPHCLHEPAFTRYRTLVQDAFVHGVQAVIAGRLRDQVAPAIWFERQSRHTTLLSLIEAGYLADERYADLPRDDRWLADYREQLLLTRTILERRLELPDSEDTHRHQVVLDAYTSLLDLRVQLLRRISDLSDSGVPADAAPVQTYRHAGEAQVTILARLVGLARGVSEDGDRHWRQEEREHRELTRGGRLLELADRWLSFALEHRETEALVNEQVEAVAEDLAAPIRAAMAAATVAQRTAQAAFAAAVAARDPSAALLATQAAERYRLGLDQRLSRLDEDLAIAEREKRWRVHAQDPAIAEHLHTWDARRAAAATARQAADDAATAALLARHAAERAGWDSEEAEARAALAQEAAEEHDLSEMIEALDEMVELRAGTIPPE